MYEGKNPDEDAGGNCVHRSPLQAVLDGESHTEVAFYADCGEEECAVVNGHVENEARQRAEDERHVPVHVVHPFVHLERKEKEKEEVRDGEVEEQDVARGGFLPHFLAESIESKDIGWESQDKGYDVDGQTQRSGVIRHGGLGLSQLISQGIEMCHIILIQAGANTGRVGSICHTVRAAVDGSFLLGQQPGTNLVRQRGFLVPTDKPTLIVSLRALGSADKREWKEITTLRSALTI